MVHIMEHTRDGSTPGSLAGSQSVDRALALLGMVGRRPLEGASLGELVAESGLNKPTVRRLMLALIRNGMVEQNEATRRYFLGEESYILGTFAAHRHGLLELSFEPLSRLAQQTGDAAFLSVRRGFSALCLHREEGAALDAASVHVDRAGTAVRRVAPDVDARHAEVLAKVLHQQRPRLDVVLVGGPVDGDGDLHRRSQSSLTHAVACAPVGSETPPRRRGASTTSRVLPVQNHRKRWVATR